jgi:hypothetical protein
MSDTIVEGCDTESYEFRFGTDFGIEVAALTVEGQEPPFEEIKNLCSDIPLRFYRYPPPDMDAAGALEDEADLHDALEALKEPGSISLDDFKKQLGI